MERFLLAAVLVAVAVAVAVVLERRRAPDAPTQNGTFPVPLQLDRDDFEARDKPWLVVVFTSETCDSCARATAKAAVLESGDVGYQEVPWQTRKDLHDRYGVEVVPMILVADADGVVRKSFVGVPTATDLWAAMADAREPGASPEPGLGSPAPEA